MGIEEIGKLIDQEFANDPEIGPLLAQAIESISGLMEIAENDEGRLHQVTGALSMIAPMVSNAYTQAMTKRITLGILARRGML